MGWIFGIAALIALLIWLAKLAAKARRGRIAAFEALAEEHGLRFDTSVKRRLNELYPQLPVLQRGSSQKAYDTLRGKLQLFDRPCRLVAGEFSYETKDSDGDTHTSRFSYLLVHLPWPTPRLEIRDENWLDKVAAAFGADDIDLESDEFSRKYHVKSSDKRFAYDLLHARTMEFLLAEGANGLTIADGVLCLSDGSRTWDPPEFDCRIEFVELFCELWPRHLLAAENG